MSDTWLPRSPAHSSLRPPEPLWNIVDEAIADKLRAWTKSPATAKVESLSRSLEGIQGYYRIDAESSLFVKIVSASASQQQTKSAQIARWLKQNGLSVSALLPEYPLLSDDGENVLLAYELINGRFARYKENDLRSIGRELGNMHRLFSVCPWMAEVKKNGLLREKSLEEQRQWICNGNTVASIPGDVLSLISDANPVDLTKLSVDPQVVHGDLNYGNVLIESTTGRGVFLDFEDAYFSWFSPHVDIAFVVERFVLVESDEESLHLAHALISSYAASLGSCSCSSVGYEQVLRGLSLRALLLLSKIARGGGVINQTEWRKFIDLTDQTHDRSELLGQISVIAG